MTTPSSATQDPELSAALGWPGGTSDPVLDRKTLLRMVAALRLASQQALEALQWHYRQGHSNTLGGFRLKIDEKALRGLRAALAQQAEPLNLADPAVQKRLAAQWGYVPAATQAEPVQEPAAWYSVDAPLNYMTRCADGTVFTNTVAMPAHAVAWSCVAPPQRTMVPLTKEEIDALPWFGSPRQFARTVEKASWGKNHG